jgi:hypothetical protein
MPDWKYFVEVNNYSQIYKRSPSRCGPISYQTIQVQDVGQKLL